MSQDEPNSVLPLPSRKDGPINLTRLAEHKRLPRAFLSRECGLTDLPRGAGVGIPYYDDTGFEMLVKRRTALRAGDGSIWPTGRPLIAYGLWRLDRAYKEARLFLVEGESDCWALWHHNLPALGLPGSHTAGVLTAKVLAGIDTIYVHREPDAGGAAFVASVLARLTLLEYRGRVLELHMKEGTKDPADLHAEDPDKFEQWMAAAVSAAKPLSLRLAVRPAEQGQPRGTPLADVPVQPVRWLWPGRVPFGKLTVLDGDPGLGKSSLALDLAARLSTGRPMPFAESTALPASAVVLVSAEDGDADTIRPRLEAAGANVRLTITLEGIDEANGLRPVSFPDDAGHLETLIRRHDAKLVVIDPLMAFLADHVNSHNDQNARRALLALAKLAERTGAAVVIIRHLNKQAGRNALYRGGGSIGIIGAARSGLLVAKDPSDPERRVLAVTKSNLSKPAATLRFEVREQGTTSAVVWLDESPHDADELLRETAEKSEAPLFDEAADWLRQALAKGPRPAADLLREATQAGISERTLRRAKTVAGVNSYLQPDPSGNGGTWSWAMAPVEV